MSAEPLQVAIAGAGIAGLITYAALSKLGPRIQIELYEASSTLGEVGASIALGPNGLRTLHKLGIKLDDPGFKNASGLDHTWCDGKTGQVIGTTRYASSIVTDEAFRTTRFARADLHNALRRLVPADRIHLGKRFSHVDVDAGGATLHFKDGTTARAHVVVGADGIRSYLPHYNLAFTNAIAYRGNYDASTLPADVLHDLTDEATHWLSDTGVSLFTSPLARNRFTLAAFDTRVKTSEPATLATRWDKAAPMDRLREMFTTEHWTPAIARLFEVIPASETRQYPVFTGPPLPRWNFDQRVLLAGDAAHPHGGSFAAGSALAIDDAYALYLALGKLFESTPTDDLPTGDAIEQALNLYNSTRASHARRIIEAVTNKASSGGWHDLGVPDDSRAPSWIVGHDVEATFEVALPRPIAV